MARNKPHRVLLVLLFRLFVFFINLFPLRVALFWGRMIGALIFYILGREREKALANLDIAFGASKSSIEKSRIVRGLFENLGKNIIELLKIGGFNKDNIGDYIKCNNIKVFEHFLNEGRSVIAVSAHFGNWELLAHYFAIKGVPITVIARRVRMEYFEDFLLKIRKRHDLNVIYRDDSAKEVISLLKGRNLLGIMPDQDMDSVSGVFVDFFGKPAYTPNGPSVLNFLTGSPIVPCFMVRREYGHEIFIEEPMELSKTGDREKDMLENTKRYTKVIETYIRRFPSQWVWFHDRWKTQQRKT